jgi:hypothetical protein
LGQGKARGVISANSPAMVVLAMQIAYQVRAGVEVPKRTYYELGTYATDTSFDIGTTYEKIEIGKNAFTDHPGGFSPVYDITNTPPNPPMWVHVTLDDVKAAGSQ